MQSLVIYFSKAGQNYVNGEIKSLEVGNTEVVSLKISASGLKRTNVPVLSVFPTISKFVLILPRSNLWV